jgi:N-methylhydantoinase B
VRLLRGEGKASFLMDHGRLGPSGLMGGDNGATNEIRISQDGQVTRPVHLSKGEGYVLGAGDWVDVKTPGGGGYGSPAEREPSIIERDQRRGDYPGK